MSLQAIARLEELIDQLLAERLDLQKRNGEISAECDRLVADRARVSDELGKLLEKLELLEQES